MSTSSCLSSSGIASISAASRASCPSNTSRCDLVARYAPPAIDTPDATIADRPPMSTTRGSMLAPPTPASTPRAAAMPLLVGDHRRPRVFVSLGNVVRRLVIELLGQHPPQHALGLLVGDGRHLAEVG